jgi:LytS/YehU family sensor histidine kinase
VQLPLAAAFGLLAQPALQLGEHLFHPAYEVSDRSPHAALGWLTNTDLALWFASATNFLLQYGFGLALITAFRLYQRYRDAELRAGAIEKAWSAARLAALRMQLSPHTLFNLLHVIRGQVAWDPRVAQSMIVQLADLLRRLLAAGEQDFSRLREEMQFVRLYLQLQQQRFIDRLTVELPVEEQLPDVWVPSLILQPLAENAVVHGLAGHDGPVRVRVEVTIDKDALVLQVSNDRAPSAAVGATGIGIANVRERLAVHFSGAAHFHAAPDDRGGWVAEIRMPALRVRPAGVAP